MATETPPQWEGFSPEHRARLGGTMLSHSCSWCHTINQETVRWCPSCGHAAQSVPCSTARSAIVQGVGSPENSGEGL